MWLIQAKWGTPQLSTLACRETNLTSSCKLRLPRNIFFPARLCVDIDSKCNITLITFIIRRLYITWSLIGLGKLFSPSDLVFNSSSVETIMKCLPYSPSSASSSCACVLEKMSICLSVRQSVFLYLLDPFPSSFHSSSSMEFAIRKSGRQDTIRRSFEPDLALGVVSAWYIRNHGSIGSLWAGLRWFHCRSLSRYRKSRIQIIQNRTRRKKETPRRWFEPDSWARSMQSKSDRTPLYSNRRDMSMEVGVETTIRIVIGFRVTYPLFYFNMHL